MAIFNNVLSRAQGLYGAYLISSSGEGDAAEYAEELMRRVLCKAHTGCGVCSQCVKFDAGEHVDVFKLDGSAKKVEFDRMDGFLSMRAMEGMHVVYICNAQDMSASAANGMLKALEDKLALFLLTTSNVSGVLPTIKSRCMHLHIPPVSRKDVLSSLSRTDEGAVVAAALSGGYKSRAKSLLEDEEYLAMRREVLGVCEDVVIGRQHPVELATKLSVYGDIARVIEIMWMYFSDAYRIKLGCDTLLFTPDREKSLKICAESFTYERIYNIIKGLAMCSVYKNRNARLAYEQTLLNLSEVT